MAGCAAIAPGTKCWLGLPRPRNRVEGWVAIGPVLACSCCRVLTTVGIVFSLIWESLPSFQAVPVIVSCSVPKWSPQIAIRADQVGSSGAFGAVPLFAGTFLIMAIAMLVAGPVGLVLGHLPVGVRRAGVRAP